MTPPGNAYLIKKERPHGRRSFFENKKIVPVRLRLRAGTGFGFGVRRNHVRRGRLRLRLSLCLYITRKLRKNYDVGMNIL